MKEWDTFQNPSVIPAFDLSVISSALFSVPSHQIASVSSGIPTTGPLLMPFPVPECSHPDPFVLINLCSFFRSQPKYHFLGEAILTHTRDLIGTLTHTPSNTHQHGPLLRAASQLAITPLFLYYLN